MCENRMAGGFDHSSPGILSGKLLTSPSLGLSERPSPVSRRPGRRPRNEQHARPTLWPPKRWPEHDGLNTSLVDLLGLRVFNGLSLEFVCFLIQTVVWVFF